MILDKRSGVPYYQQVKSSLLNSIKTGNWAPEQLIPPEIELQKVFGVSRTTIRQAIGELVNEGYLYRKKGVGTYVSDVVAKVPFAVPSYVVANTSKLLQIVGKNNLYKKVLRHNQIPANKNLAQTLAVSEGTLLWHFDRIEYGDGIPLSRTSTYVSVDTIADEMFDVPEIEVGFHNYLQRLGYPISYIRTNVSAQFISDHQSLMDLERKSGMVSLVIDSINCLEDKTPIEYSRSIFNSSEVYIPIIQSK